jgi:hypothetical protein
MSVRPIRRYISVGNEFSQQPVVDFEVGQRVGDPMGGVFAAIYIVSRETNGVASSPQALQQPLDIGRETIHVLYIFSVFATDLPRADVQNWRSKTRRFDDAR